MFEGWSNLSVFHGDLGKHGGGGSIYGGRKV